MPWRALIVLGLCGSVAYAQPVVPSWRPPSGCTSGQAIVFNGSIWTCGSAGVTNSAGANVIPKSDGANLVASQCTDNGTTMTCTGTINAQTGLQVNGTSVATTSNIAGTIGRSARFTGTNTVGTGAFTDDGTNATAQGTFATLGNFTAGDSTSADAHTVNGRLTHNVAGFADGFTTTSTASGATYSQNAGSFNAAGTFDASAAVRENYALKGQATGTRSAGAQSVINYGVFGSASGGQVNYAGYFAAGDVALNVSSGNTCIGAASCSNKLYVGGTATIAAGNSSAAAGIGGTVLTIRQADGSNHYLTMQGTSNIGINFATPSSGERGTVRYSSGADALRFRTAGTIRMNITNNGTIQLGDSSNTAVNNNVDILTIGNTGTGQTSSAALINATHTGSFSTAGGNITYYGGNIAVSATESAGTGTLTAVALRLSATGADVNYGLYVEGGESRFDGDFTVNGTRQRGIRNHVEDRYLEWTDEWLTTLPQSPQGGTSTEIVGSGVEYLSVASGVSTTSASISGLAHTSAVDGHPGVVRFDTGSTTDGNLYRVTDRTMKVGASGTRHSYEAVVRFPILSDASSGNTYGAVVGFISTPMNAPAGGNGCWIAYDENNSTGDNPSKLNKFMCGCDNAATLVTERYLMDGSTVSSGSFTTVDAPVVADTWYKLRIDVSDSMAEFYIDDVKSCQIDNIPDGQFSAAGWALKKTGGSTAVQMDVDYTGLSIDLGAGR